MQYWVLKRQHTEGHTPHFFGDILNLLEERDDHFVILDDDGTVSILPKGPYTNIKLLHGFNERPIDLTVDGAHIYENGDIIAEMIVTDSDGKPVTDSKGNSVNLIDWKLVEDYLNGEEEGLKSTIAAIRELGYIHAKVTTGSQMNINRNGEIRIPVGATLTVLERTEYHDGSRLLKVSIEMGSDGWRYTDPVYYALVGRDETGQYWMHFIPPEFKDRSVWECDVWLCGGEPGDTVIFSPKGQEVNAWKYTGRATSC
jgi:hypothetical protein